MEPSEATPLTVDPNAVIQELQQINSDLTLQLAAARAAVRQQTETVAGLQKELAAKVEE